MTEEEKKELKIPAHVAIILDGNGRWAKKRGLPRNMGHVEGCKVVEQTVEDAARLGIQYLTVYGFSTENWKRSAEGGRRSDAAVPLLYEASSEGGQEK